MNIKKIFAAALAGACLLQMPCAYAEEETEKAAGIVFTAEELAEMGFKPTLSSDISAKAKEFVKRYPYGEITREEAWDMMDKLVEKYGDAAQGLGINKREAEDKNDKNYYMDAAFYDDGMAAFFGDTPKFSDAKIMVNGEEYQGSIFKSRALASTEVFEALGCEVSFDEEAYVLTIAKDGNVLEMMPYLLAMRKNKEDGEWIPLGICARFLGEESEELNVPVRAIAEELGLTVEWDNDNRAVVLKN